MANILVVGAGTVGTATARGFAEHDHKVTVVDSDAAARARMGELGFVTASPAEADLTDTEVVVVAVSAPTGVGGVELTHLFEASRTLGMALRQQTPDAFTVIVYRCTVPPGTTRRLTAVLESVSAATVGVEFGVAYSPEYLRATTAYEDFLTPPLVTVGVLGEDRRTPGILRDLFRPFGGAVEFIGVEEAEFQKYVHNLFNAVKISFFNEMRQIAARLRIDGADRIFEITARTAEGLWNPRYGIADLGPYAGACLPKDAAAWLVEMERLGAESAMVTAARAVNARLGGR